MRVVEHACGSAHTSQARHYHRLPQARVSLRRLPQGGGRLPAHLAAERAGGTGHVTRRLRLQHQALPVLGLLCGQGGVSRRQGSPGQPWGLTNG